MKQWLDNLLTPDEQKILGFVLVFAISGMILYYTGVSTILAQESPAEYEQLAKAVEKDTLIQIDLRTATLAELDLLPGIGPKKALAILDYRKKKQFSSPEELQNIKGIGAKTFANLQSMLLPFGTTGAGVVAAQKTSSASSQTSSPSAKATDTTIVNLNTAGLAELMTLSGIGEKKALAILDYRKQIGKFTSIEQFTEVKGIGTKTLDKNRSRLKI
jgi:competence protein ComEA